jgi:putative hydroxymethylpyrimidine transport system substrate-binding protein
VAAVASLIKANPGLDRSFQLAAVRATLPAFFPATASEPWGWQDSAQWTAYGEWMLNHHLISNPVAIAQAESNDFLAGVGP